MRQRNWKIAYLFMVAELVSAMTLVFSSARGVTKLLPPGPGWWDSYPAAKNLLPQAGVPKGIIFTFPLNNSKIFPGTQRQIQVYIPAEYKGKKPACVYVRLDAFGPWSFATFNNLIYKKQIPITIGIGLPAGVTPSVPANTSPRFERSYEFDALNDNVGRFIIQEVLPAVERQHTPSGLPILLSKNPNNCAIMGGSSGGTGAFTVAWDNPNVFRRVLIYNGTFVDMRGAEDYPSLVRKTVPEPLRIFMGDGCHDEWWPGAEMGNWWLNSRAMESALKFAGYQVHHIWGYNTHSGSLAAATYPQALRWLWQGRHPKPITAGISGNPVLRQIYLPAEHWQKVFSNPAGLGNLASDSQGRIFIQSSTTGKIFCLSRGVVRSYATINPGGQGLAVGPGGSLYTLDAIHGHITEINSHGQTRIIATGIHGNNLCVMPDGNIYVTDPKNGTLWLVDGDGKVLKVAQGLSGPTGVAPTPDDKWLCVAESNSHYAMSYRIEPNGTLRYGIPFYWLYQPGLAANSGVGQLCFDRGGFLYAATRMGVQVLDQANGFCTAILPVPEGYSRRITGICFGGGSFHTLYVTTAHSLYAREMKSQGVIAGRIGAALPRMKIPWH
ncbi:MAG: SMP-30/gluconolactonase/LRE family protein [Phycisphaerae bacterium]